VHSFTDSDVSDTNNIVPFENTTPINQNNKGKIKKNTKQIDEINRSGIFKGYNVVTVMQSESVNERNHTDQQNV